MAGDQGSKLSQGGRLFTSALFDDTLTEQNMCVIFYCKNEFMYCVVNIEHFQVSDISGKADQLPRGSIFWNMTPQDIFALFMTIFGFIFFCIQCCCFCKICCAEMSGGVVDEEALMEKEIKRQYMKERGRGPKLADKHRKKRKKDPAKKRKGGEIRQGKR